jgi:hypothetical protein
MNSTTHPSLKPIDLLVHPNLLIRVLSNWLIGFIIFFSVWTLSYVALPLGSIQFSIANLVLTSAGEAVLPEALRIFAWNLCLAGGLVVLSSLFVVGDFPAGYLLPWIICALYGALLGTNSFALPDPAGESAPSLVVLWTRAGDQCLPADRCSSRTDLSMATARVVECAGETSTLLARIAPVKRRGNLLDNRRWTPRLVSLR